MEENERAEEISRLIRRIEETLKLPNLTEAQTRDIELVFQRIAGSIKAIREAAGMALLGWDPNSMDLKEKLKRERDELQELLAWAHTMFPNAIDPVEEITTILVAEGIYDEVDRVTARDLKQDYGSINGLIEAGKIESEQAQQLLYLLDVRSKALMTRIGERMADTFGTDPNVFITAEDDEE
jgi:hypothetical protein